jgi:hypothetical protein
LLLLYNGCLHWCNHLSMHSTIYILIYTFIHAYNFNTSKRTCLLILVDILFCYSFSLGKNPNHLVIWILDWREMDSSLFCTNWSAPREMKTWIQILLQVLSTPSPHIYLHITSQLITSVIHTLLMPWTRISYFCKGLMP